MAWVDGKAFWLFLPAFADVLIRCQSFERFESLREIIGHQEGMQMLFQVVMGHVVIPFYGGLFERAIHPFHLAIGPRMVGFGQPMVNPVCTTDAIKDMVKGIAITLPIGKLDAVIGEHRLDLVGYSSNQVP
jgi:hypothetical protein